MAPIQGAASFYAQGQPAPRGSRGRTDDVWGLDATVKYDFQVAGLDMNLRLDVFNLFDNDSVTEVEESADLATGAANVGFLSPTHHQPPRVVRLGVGITF